MNSGGQVLNYFLIFFDLLLSLVILKCISSDTLVARNSNTLPESTLLCETSLYISIPFCVLINENEHNVSSFLFSMIYLSLLFCMLFQISFITVLFNLCIFKESKHFNG